MTRFERIIIAPEHLAILSSHIEHGAQVPLMRCRWIFYQATTTCQ